MLVVQGSCLGSSADQTCWWTPTGQQRRLWERIRATTLITETQRRKTDSEGQVCRYQLYVCWGLSSYRITIIMMRPGRVP